SLPQQPIRTRLPTLPFFRDDPPPARPKKTLAPGPDDCAAGRGALARPRNGTGAELRGGAHPAARPTEFPMSRMIANPKTARYAKRSWALAALCSTLISATPA